MVRRAHHNTNRVTFVRGRGKDVVPPKIKDGKVRCEVCRNAVSITGRGYLRKHNDLFGHPCSNKRVPEES